MIEKTTYKKLDTAQVSYVEKPKEPIENTCGVWLFAIETKLIQMHLLSFGNLCLVQIHLTELLQFQKPWCSVL